MVDDIEGTPSARGGKRRRLITIVTAIGVVIVLAAGAAVAYGAAADARAAADLKAAQDEALPAAIRDAVLVRGDAYAIAAEARVVSDAAGDLLSDDERNRLLAPIDELDEHIETALPTERELEEIVDYADRFSPLVEAVRGALQAAVDVAIDAASNRLTADALASMECRDAVTAAIEALHDVDPTGDLVAALLAAVDAADKSDEEAAAVAAGTAVGSGTGGGGPSGGTGGAGGTGGTTPGPRGPANPPPLPPYTDADARAAVVNAYGLGPYAGTCLAMNWGTWSRNSVPPPPRFDLLPVGGWMGYAAWSTGTGGEVHYYACK